MQNNPLVSIIIPIYNGEQTLRGCLNSVVNQTYEHFEIILVDNNSTDNTKKIIQKYQKKFKNILYVFETKKGRGSARYAGEQKTKGEIILMTDCDATVPQDWIHKMIEPIVSGRADAVQGFEEPMEKNFWSDQQQIRVANKWSKYNEQTKILGNIDTKNFVIAATTLKEIGYSASNYIDGNDTDLSFKLAIFGKKVVWLKEVKVKHLHPSTFFEVLVDQFRRGYWSSKILEDYKKRYMSREFLNEKAHTLPSFYNLFGLIKHALTLGLSYAFVDLSIGIPWRLGIIWFKIKNKTDA